MCALSRGQPDLCQAWNTTKKAAMALGPSVAVVRWWAYPAGMKRAHVLLVLCAVAAAAESAQEHAAAKRAGAAFAVSRVNKVEELNWRQIHALDRERTLVLLPVGMLEQHGTHLPVGADTLGSLTRQAAFHGD